MANCAIIDRDKLQYTRILSFDAATYENNILHHIILLYSFRQHKSFLFTRKKLKSNKDNTEIQTSSRVKNYF